jgi:hypothetical protein
LFPFRAHIPYLSPRVGTSLAGANERPAEAAAGQGWPDAPTFRVRWTGERYSVDGPAEAVVGTPVLNEAGDVTGIHGRWSWDGRSLIVRIDRYGHMPLFVAAGPGWAAVSTSIPALLRAGAPGDLDLDALGVFLRLGVFIGEDTPFTAVRALPPGATWRWDRHGAVVEAAPLPITGAIDVSRQDAIEEYVRLMRRAVRRRLPAGASRPVVPFSGGADSRHVLLELLAAGVDRPWCPTMRMPPPRADHDAHAVAAIAADLQVDHEIIDSFRSRVAAEIEKHWRTSFCSITLTWSLPLVHRFGPGDTVYDGLGGDVLSAGVDQSAAWYRLSLDGAWDTLAGKVVRPNEALLARLLTRSAYRRMPRDAALARIAAELARHAGAANPLGSFMFFNENRRNLALRPMALFDGTAGTVHTPFLDDDVVSFLSGLPAPMTTRNMDGLDFHTDAIRCAHPGVPDWPYAYTATDLRRGVANPLPTPSRTAHFRRASLETLARIGRHRSRLVDRVSLAPRLARQAARRSQHYGRDLFAIYLVELERLASGATAPSKVLR